MSALSNLSKLRGKCRKVRSSFLLALLRHLFFRLRGKNILTSNGVTIYGLQNISTTDSLTIGLNYVGFMSRHDRTLVNVCGRLDFRGRFSVGKGCRIDIAEGATAEFGGGYINGNTTFVIMHGITVGDDCAISWGCQFIDEDFHKLDYPGKVPKDSNHITIGSHVWIGSNVTILKGAVIPDGCVVASGSIVSSAFDVKNALLAGSPARVIRENVSWN